MSGYPLIAHPSVVLAPSLAGLVVAVCRECPWHSAPATHPEATLQRDEHRAAHRAGGFPAPFHRWAS